MSVAPGLAAQWQVTGDVGLSRLVQSGFATGTAQSFGGSIDGLMSRGWLRSSVLASRTSAERWTAQTTTMASLMSPLDRRVRWDLSGAVTAFAETNSKTASSAEALGRVLFGRARLGGALGLGGGARRADAGAQPVGRLSASGWTSIGNESFGADVAYVATSTNPANRTVRIGLSYTDLSASWRHDQGAFSIGGVIGARTSNSVLIPRGTWGSADGMLRVTPRMAIVASAGQQPQDVVRGVPRITYATVGLRFTSLARPALFMRRPSIRGPQLIATRERVEIRAEGATRVEVMADFTDWAPVVLVRAGDVWRLERAMSPGLHRIMMRIDGGEWTTPANLPTATDDLGGVVALVTVP